MTECPHCSHRFHADAYHPPTHCPECDRALRVNQPSEWTPVARLSNLADSGFFCDVLADSGIEVQLKEIDEFSALLGLWETVYVLQVPREAAQRAADVMNEQLKATRDSQSEDSADEDADEDTAQIDAQANFQPWASNQRELGWPDDLSGSSSTSLWKSVAVVLVAGGLAYGVGLSTALRDVDAGPSADQDMLWQALSQSGETFVSEGPPGARRYRLHFDARTNRIEIAEDIDGDGRYDRRRAYERGRLITHR